MKAKCLQPVDVGDGVVFFCGLDARHDGPHHIVTPQRGTRCLHTRDEHPRGCIRAQEHAGPHKYGDEAST